MNNALLTKWGRALDPAHVLEDYPRPAMKRDSFICLNGYWDYAITDDEAFPEQVDGSILVPFSPEAALSGVNRQLMPDQVLHYSRRFTVEKPESGKRLLLHFGAVDQSCAVYVNGEEAGRNEGGYWHFSFDITDLVQEGENLLQVVVRDPSDSSYQARGKQSLERGGMWYTPQSGIWQTVWMEYVPEQYIKEVSLVPDIDTNSLQIRVLADSGERLPMEFTVSLEDRDLLTARGMTEDTCRVVLPEVKLWTPESPVLYDITVRFGEDEIASYFAMRKISVEKDSSDILRLFLNGKPYFHNGILDQGYFPDGLYTPPSDEAMVDDILQMKALGFNMLRKHAKIEPDRWYWHCDRLGMLVWQDMVNGGSRKRSTIKATVMETLKSLKTTVGGLMPEKVYLSRDENLRLFLRDSAESREEFTREVKKTIRQLLHYPSIVVWTVFNEAWGECEGAPVTRMIRQMDPTRLVDEASGWIDQGGGDIISSHNYFLPLSVKPQKNRCVALSEFGGYSWHIGDHSWTEDEFGYRRYPSREELTAAIEKLWKRDLMGNLANGLSATAYTEVSDVEDETNGLLTYDREILKVDGEKIRELNRELMELFAKLV